MIQPILQPQKPSEHRKIYSVGELAIKTRRLLEGEIGQIWITGEISNLSTPASGHWYFTLKDNNAQLRCAIFKGKNRSARFTPENGQQILMRAKISMYEARGDLQLIGEYVEPAGEGALQIAFERLKKKLEAEGLFEQALKREIPKYPTKIGVITSSSGAAILDVLSVLQRRMPQIPVVIYPSLVQGDRAAVSLMKQIEIANQAKQCDVLLLTRGGGSLEDLWCFNDEHLARAIRNSDIPIVSAVGHEVDFSISDWAADLRAPTPSVAAELLVPDRIELLNKVSQLARRLGNELNHKLEVAQATLDKTSAKIVHPKQKLNESRALLRETSQELLAAYRQIANDKYAQLLELQYRFKGFKPQHELEYRKSQLAQSNKSLNLAMQNMLKDNKQSVAMSARQLNDLSPLATLQRGYTITEDLEGNALTSVKQAKKAKELVTKFADGEVKSKLL